MGLQPNDRVRARGLLWDVGATEPGATSDRLTLRCAEGDLAGLDWDFLIPPDSITPAAARLDPTTPGELSRWRLVHQAHCLNTITGEAAVVARNPGRLRLEPYQLVPLTRALDLPRVRLLLADGVGLGKTIQAGLIASELIARRRAHRILIAAPSGPLLTQWRHEMRDRFAQSFTPITSAAELWDLRRAHPSGANPFDRVALCLTSLDFAKQDHVLEELDRATWDLVIIDEAHHCAANAEPSHRRRLAEVLARRSDALLLLTATPHDGHDAHFASLIALLDPSLVDGLGGFSGRDYRRHVIRRLKSHIRDPATGAYLFRPRIVQPIKVDVNGPEHEPIRAFHRALSAFAVPRLRRSGDGLAFVSLLKRSVSTIAACLATLRVVLDRLDPTAPPEPRAAIAERSRALRAWRRRATRFGGLSAADEASQQAIEIESMAESLRARPDPAPSALLALGQSALAHDPKLATLTQEIRLIRLDHPRANILIYTEYTASQAAAANALRNAMGIAGPILTIGGQDTDIARATAAENFSSKDQQILISTDALAEGLNLHQHCHHLIHLDLPYNPNRLEQRNGRIDRYGQRHDPEIRYLYIPGTFEENLLLHLIAKYEKARAVLDVMPDTIGLTANPDDYGKPLTRGLSEDPADLFKPDHDPIRSLDRAAADTSPETVAALLRDIDRAYEAFDRMALSHGWFGAQGFNSGRAALADAMRATTINRASPDLAAFVRGAIAAHTGAQVPEHGPIPLPKPWLTGLAELPGIDMARATFTDDINASLLNRSHPLVVRALPLNTWTGGITAAARHDRIALLLTFLAEITAGGRVIARRLIAILTRPDRPPIEISDPLAFATTETTASWSRDFAAWAPAARQAAETMAQTIAAAEHASVLAHHAIAATARRRHLDQWLSHRATLLTGRVTAATGDLFASPAPTTWRAQPDPRPRLIGFATDPETPAGPRREANDTLETHQALLAAITPPDPVQCRPIGLLMLVPNAD